MPCPLLTDCLNEVLENLDDDKVTLHSCLLVNRLWCRVSVRILWRNIWSFKYSRQLKVKSAILSTLISCLPNESKEILHKNEIFISTPTSKPPLFDYASFCKVLSVDDINRMIHKVLQSNISFASQNLKDKNLVISKELLKMFMNQISSLKTLYHKVNYDIPNNISFINFPGARDCLTDLSELHCSTIIHSEFFHGLSQICHNLQSLNIYFQSKVSSELKELVSSQNNLKNLTLAANNLNDWADIVPALTKHSNTLTKLCFYMCNIDRLPLSFVSSFLNLQEISFSLINEIQFEDFKKLQFVTFSKLQTLKISYKCPKPEYLMKFLEINGKNLQELYICKASNLSIDKYCPNLKKLSVLFGVNELDILKNIFNSCHYLEGIVIWCKVSCLNEKEVLDTVAKHSSKNFYELKLHDPILIPENLESFFVSWKNRASKKSLSLIIVGIRLKVKKESMKIIEKYKNLGVIKKFEIREYCEKEMYL